jgi:hypothetical protein
VPSEAFGKDFAINRPSHPISACFAKQFGAESVASVSGPLPGRARKAAHPENLDIDPFRRHHDSDDLLG